MTNLNETLLPQVEKELKDNILAFWMNHALDEENGGFRGEIRNDLSVVADAHKSLVLNARILWTFSSAYRLFPDPAYRQMAERALGYLKERFQDPVHGGFYWGVDAKGNPAETKKQVYGQSFVIYALSEWYRATKDQAALDEAVKLFELLEKYAYDPVNKGYVEALNRDWSPTEELSLSGKDLNEPKSMNTHLHVLEGYTNLYRVWPSAALQKTLKELIEVTIQYIVDPKTAHFLLFFDEEWAIKSHHISYGHDIEGSWLLVEAAEVLGNDELTERVKEVAIRMAEATLQEGVDKDGGIWNEASADGTLLDPNKDWWPQAEAMVGFYNAYQMTEDTRFEDAAVRSWSFIDQYIADRTNGEWYWGVTADGKPVIDQSKVSAWKCPYHNGRACMEMIERLEKKHS
ncbi:AGE family epimerase/isomerase [Gorillibacterium timonense]|uniref:AGE family epimerase/isomerase n=1 Tax=Gorillibacterium timonense TaxID=1689269 RepID=UPI00071E51B6|nr:AGE family epimerase/isomerase [Gorillibacterium timonense]